MPPSGMTTPADLSEQTLEWLRQSCSAYSFFVERDVSGRINPESRSRRFEAHLPHEVFNDHPVLPGARRHVSADLALLDAQTDLMDG